MKLSPSMNDQRTGDDPALFDLAEEMAARIQTGDAAGLEAWIAAQGEHADRLRRLLPTVRVMAELGSAAGGSAPPPGTEREPVPGVLGDFRIIREVGRGGMGVVYEAEQVSLGRRVALKVLPLAATMDARQLQRFHNEARAAAGLHHTNIVPVHAVGCERGVHYYAMQFIEGRTLADFIAQQRRESVQEVPTTPVAEAAASATTAPPAAQATSVAPRDAAYFRRAAEWGIQAAEALDCAHTLGVVHRDVKPGNLLVDAAGRLWVTDFGLAQVQSDARLTMSGDLVGTLRYMSPEQALAKRVVIDHRTDIYSLGATLYELLTLQPAYSGNDRQELLRQIAFEEPQPPRRVERAIPAELEVIVLKALEKNPAERYGTAQELADDLRRWLDDRPIQARRPSVVQRLRRWVWRRRAAVRAAAAVLLLATLLAASVGLWSLQKRAGAQAQARAALDEAARYLQDERWLEALSAVRQAQGVLAGFWADAALQRQANELAKDLEMAQKLQEARLQRTDLRAEHFDWEQTDAGYAAAFETYGLDLDRLDPEAAAQHIRGRLIHRQLVAALDDWAVARRELNSEGWAQRLAVARAADPDPWRNRLRDALEGKDPIAQEEGTAINQADDWAVDTLVLLGILAQGRASGERAAALLGRAQQRHPGDFWINETLAEVLDNVQPPRREEAIRFLSVAVGLRPQSPGARVNLGMVLKKAGRLDEAIAEFHEALRLKPDFAAAHYDIGVVLANKGQLADAIREYGEALRLRKDYPEAHLNLGEALAHRGRLEEAISEYREALRVRPSYPEAHVNLGNALVARGQLDDAFAEYREALRLRKDDPFARYNLGNLLKGRGRLDEAIAEYREAIRVMKDFPEAHCQLGNALRDRGRQEEAMVEFREALRINKDFLPAGVNLGSVLEEQGRLEEAITEYREALRAQPQLPWAHYGLGNALWEKGQMDEAIAERRETIRLSKDFPEAHNSLGAALRTKGQFHAAIAELQEALRLNKDFAQARDNLRQAEQMAQLNDRLPAVLLGKDQPKDAAERVAFAQLCQLSCREQYAAAARFYTDAFTAEPPLAEKLGEVGSRYDAACAAALAGCGQGKDAHRSDDKERTRLRRQARDWLRADLAAWQKLLEKEPEKTGAGAAQQLAHWLEDTDFATVRGPEALAKLPEAEHRDWQQLWDEVAGTLARAQGKSAPDKKPDSK
jgi:serine/threonine protein kinase/Flp pilus assembly protein TadD